MSAIATHPDVPRVKRRDVVTVTPSEVTAHVATQTPAIASGVHVGAATVLLERSAVRAVPVGSCRVQA
jgi:hypothetical protein